MENSKKKNEPVPIRREATHGDPKAEMQKGKKSLEFEV
jgi:hypothetical protein